MKRLALGAALAAMLAGGGCGNKAEQSVTLMPSEFYSKHKAAQPATAPTAVAPVTQPSPAEAGQDVAQTSEITAIAPVTQPASRPTLAARPEPRPAAPSATRRAGASLGTYMIVGTVIAEVNGKPVFADKVLTRVDPALSAKAALEPREFRLVATGLVQQAVEAEIREELEYAAAQRNVTEEEEQAASGLTTVFRQREINKAGGSLAVARRRSLDPATADNRVPMDFDERVKEQYRSYLIQIYYQEHVWKKIKITADDLRRFYEKAVDEQFTEKSAVRCRVIHCAFRDDSQRPAALSKAQGVLERAKRGEDFGVLAQTMNDNRSLAKNRGYLSLMDEPDAEGKPHKVGAWIDRGTYKLEELEKAIFALNRGELTDIIAGPDGFYIAKLEDKRPGRIREFEEMDVQEYIHKRLRTEQQQYLRQKEQARLMKSTVWRIDEKALETTVDMAMQRYATWAREDAK